MLLAAEADHPTHRERERERAREREREQETIQTKKSRHQQRHLRDVLDGVAEAVRVVVGGIDAPLVAGAVVRKELNAVGHRVELAILRPSGVCVCVCVCVCVLLTYFIRESTHGPPSRA